jgi:trimethylamine--corrinoid protein Co-methyltransferase
MEQMIVDANLWEDFRMLMRKFEISEKQIALDVVKEVGHGNNFLSNKHTIMNFRKETYFRDPKMDIYGATMSTKMREDAHKEVERILKTHVVPKLDKDILARGNEIVKNYGKNPPTHL